jgi:hypothetical protein
MPEKSTNQREKTISLQLKIKYKNTVIMYDENHWKKMASIRRLENKALKARIVEIIEGREKWKQKAKKSQQENIVLKKRINEIKKKLRQTVFS